MRHIKPHSSGQFVRTLIILIAAITVSGCRSCVSSNTNTSGPADKDTATATQSPGPTDDPTQAVPEDSPDPNPSPKPVERRDQIVAWGTKLDNDAWFFRNKRWELPLSPGVAELAPNDRVSTNQDGQAKLRFECGTIFLFHDTHLTPSPCLRSSTWSGNCLRGGAISLEVKRRTCGRKLLLATNSAEISLGNVNAAHSSMRTTQHTPISAGSSFYFPMSSVVEDQSGTTLIAYYFPKQKATLLQVRTLKHGVVEVTPVTSEGNRKQARQPGTRFSLKESECAVLQPGLLAGPDIRGVKQRTAVPCDKNFWPVLMELSQRENMTPITTENAILITEIALRRGQPIPPSELNPVLSARPREINFETQTVGEQEIQRIEIENRGKPTLTVGKPTFDGNNPSDFTVIDDNCGQQVDPKCEFRIGFTPRDVGPRRASLRIPNNGAAEPSEVLLFGFGKAPEKTIELKIDAAAQGTIFPIQKVGTAATRQVTVRNTGQVAIKIDAVSIEGEGKAAFVSNNQCTGTIPPNGSCTVEISFAPKTPELFRANLSVTATEVKLLDLAPRSIVVTGNELKGGGEVPIIELNKTELCFDKNKAVKESDPKVRQELPVTVSNRGRVSLTISKVAASNDDFKIVSESCTTRELDAGVGECLVTVGFTPRGSRLREGTLTITHDDPTHNPSNIPLKGVGTQRNIFKRVYEFIFKRTKDPCK